MRHSDGFQRHPLAADTRGPLACTRSLARPRFALLVAAFCFSNSLSPQITSAAKLDCHQADAELRKSDRIVQLPIPTTGNLDADFNATQMRLAQREVIAAHYEISCGSNPKAIQAAKDLELQAQKRLKVYHDLPQSQTCSF
jgi:hypothetical protein